MTQRLVVNRAGRGEQDRDAVATDTPDQHIGDQESVAGDRVAL